MEKNDLIIVDFFKQLLDLYEFELYIDINSEMENVFKLNDRQGANWSNIEQDDFSSLADIMERLDSPHHDYIYRSLEERQDANENIPLNDWDLIAKRYIENEKIAKVLSKIRPKDYLESNFPNTYIESKIMFQLLNEFEFPKIKQYVIPEEKLSDFFEQFSLEQLNDFEETLHLYFETDDIEYDKETLDLYSKGKHHFNKDIICLVEKVITYEDFMANYTITNSDSILSKVSQYFEENEIEDLMQYGSDSDEGLYHLSSMYQEIIDSLGIEYTNIYTENGISDGKYLTTISFENGSSIKIDTSAWNGIEVVTQNVETIYEILKQKTIENNLKDEMDFEY